MQVCCQRTITLLLLALRCTLVHADIRRTKTRHLFYAHEKKVSEQVAGPQTHILFDGTPYHTAQRVQWDKDVAGPGKGAVQACPRQDKRKLTRLCFGMRPQPEPSSSKTIRNRPIGDFLEMEPPKFFFWKNLFLGTPVSNDRITGSEFYSPKEGNEMLNKRVFGLECGNHQTMGELLTPLIRNFEYIGFPRRIKGTQLELSRVTELN